MYVYIQSEPGLWTVGFYDPKGVWQAESDWGSASDAASRANWLNGEKPTTASYHVAWFAQTAQGDSRGDLVFEFTQAIGLHNFENARKELVERIDMMLKQAGAQRTGAVVLMSVTRLS